MRLKNLKKKVLFVTNHFGYSNGVAMAMRNIIANINPDRYDVSVLAVYQYDKDFAAPIADKIHVVPGYGFYFRGFDKLVNLLPTAYLYKKFVREDYDLEVSFQYGIPTRLLSVSDKRKICWIHTYDTGLKLRKYYEKYDKVVTVAKIGCEKLIADGFPAEKADYCYNIIDENVIEEKRHEECPLKKPDKTVVVTVARLDPDKAHMRYFECINAVRDRLGNFEFWIIGGGSEEEKLRAYVRENHLEALIKITGAQPNPFPYMQQADLYYCASYREGFSTTCQEAAIMGLPVISVDVDGARELVELAGCGKVVGNNEQDIKQSLIDLAEKDGIAEWKQAAGKSRSLFFKQPRIRKIEEALDSVLGKGNE